MDYQNCNRPSIAKRITSVKKVIYAIFFNFRGETVQEAIPREITVTVKPNTGNENVRKLHEKVPP